MDCYLRSAGDVKQDDDSDGHPRPIKTSLRLAVILGGALIKSVDLEKSRYNIRSIRDWERTPAKQAEGVKSGHAYEDSFQYEDSAVKTLNEYAKFDLLLGT